MVAAEPAGVTSTDALRAGVRALTRDPASIMPYYLLAMGATMISRTPILLGGAGAILILHLQGRIEPVIRVLDDLDPALEDGGITATQQDAIAGLLTPSVVLIGVLALLATGILYVLCHAVVSAGAIHALFAGLGRRDPLSAGTAGIVRDWLPFVAIGTARAIVSIIAAVGLLFGLALTATGIGALVGIPLLLLSLLVFAVGSLLLAFAGQAVVVDDRRTVGGLADSILFPVRSPIAFGLYLLLLVAVILSVGLAGILLELAGVSRLTGLLVALVVTPLIDAIKTGLYAGESDSFRLPGRSDTAQPPGIAAVADGGRRDGSDDTPVTDAPDESLREPSRPGVISRIRTGQRRGLAELWGFLRGHPIANVVGTALFFVGYGLGWLLTAPYGVRLDAPGDVAGVFGRFAVGPFINIAANNWHVAISQGFGGIALGVPTVGNLLFNGALVGALAGVFDRTAFLALVAPHALLEVPALGISGGVGLYLGVVGYRSIRGRIDAEEVGEHLQRAAWVFVGLLPLFVLAAFVEAFLTPRIAAMILG